jgi:SNF2 family DNA or RNA helicase
VHRVVISGSIEERILELQDQKQQLVDTMMLEGGEGGGQQGNQLSEEDLKQLFRD